MAVSAHGGFTLVELIVALAAGTVVMLTITMLMVNSEQEVRSMQERVLIQREMSFLEDWLGRQIAISEYRRHNIFTSVSDYRQGRGSNEAGTCLFLSKPGDRESIIFMSDNDVRVRHDDAAEVTLISGLVEKLEFIDSGKSIAVEIELATKGESIDAEAAFTARN